MNMPAARSQGNQGGSNAATDLVMTASEAPVKFKRAYHTKTRTGCKTCKTRRVRCDEAKPACKRCTVSGRKCDGYDTTALFPFPQTASGIANQGKLQLIAAKPLGIAATGASAGSDMTLHRIGRPPEEMRSYRFYVDVTAPSLAGAFDSQFWTKEIPRVCHTNATIWHAVVSLGSAHEEYVSGKPARLKPNGFSLRHFNAAIGELTKPASKPQPWVALTASTIFTHVSILDGQLEQAILHFQAGCKLLDEAQRDAMAGSESDASDSDDQSSNGSTSEQYPVSLSSIHDILLNIEVMAAKLSVKTTTLSPTLLRPKCRFFDWATYQLPPAPPAFGRCFTVGNLSKSVSAAESLFMTLVISTMSRANNLKELYSQGGYELLHAQPLHRDPENIIEGFNKIARGIRIFTAELDRGLKIRPTELKDLRKAFYSLCFIHDASRLMLSQDPDEPNDQRRHENFPLQCKRSIDLAEEIFRLESKIGCLRSGGTVTTATVMNPLLYVAKTGFHRATRERAIRLLYVPRVEGVTDTHMPAILGHKMMARETVATREYRMQPHLNDIVIDHPTARGWDGNGDNRESIHPLGRICNYNMRFTGPKKAIIGLRTWKEWLEGSPGIETSMSW